MAEPVSEQLNGKFLIVQYLFFVKRQRLFCDGTPMETLVAIFNMADFSRELADKNIIFQPHIQNDPEIVRIMGAISAMCSCQWRSKYCPLWRNLFRNS